MPGACAAGPTARSAVALMDKYSKIRQYTTADLLSVDDAPRTTRLWRVLSAIAPRGGAVGQADLLRTCAGGGIGTTGK